MKAPTWLKILALILFLLTLTIPPIEKGEWSRDEKTFHVTGVSFVNFWYQDNWGSIDGVLSIKTFVFEWFVIATFLALLWWATFRPSVPSSSNAHLPPQGPPRRTETATVPAQPRSLSALVAAVPQPSEPRAASPVSMAPSEAPVFPGGPTASAHPAEEPGSLSPRQPSQESAPASLGGLKSTIPPLLLARCWARLLDVGVARVLFEIAIGAAVMAIGADIPYQSHPVPAYVGSFIAWVLFFMAYEALAVSTTSTTAGKWLLGIRVVSQTGGRPSMRAALSRANRATSSGLYYFVYFPYLTVFALWNCYDYARQHGKLAWDTDSGPQVTGRTIGLARHIFGFLLGFGCAVGYALWVRVEVR